MPSGYDYFGPVGNPSWMGGRAPSSYASPFSQYSPLGRQFLEVAPRSAYDIWMRMFGADPINNPKMYSYGQGLYDAYQQDYYGQSANNFGLTWLDYLDRMGSKGGLSGAYQALSPRQRGEQGPPRATWNIPR